MVVLTPGVHNAAYFEHTLLARLMGIELVEGRDLFCWRNRVYVHTTHGRRPVDVIYRRVDDDWLDPLHFRPDSVLGCPGLRQRGQARHRDDRQRRSATAWPTTSSIYTYMPDLIRYYLGEEPILENVESYRLDDPDVLDWVLGRRRQPGAQAGRRRGRRRHRHRPAATGERAGRGHEPRSGPTRAAGWRSGRSRCPPPRCSIGEKLAPRHIDLRPFAVNDGNDVWVLPGGLTRVALPEGRAQGELQPGRRIEGHLGARPRPRAAEAAAEASEPAADGRCPPAAEPARSAQTTLASRSVQMRPGRSEVNSELLSRIAETLYWTGRYVERADDTARLIDVYVHRMLGETGADSDAACRRAVRHPRRPGRGRTPSSTSTSCCSAWSSRRSRRARSPSSMLGARAGARGIREVISSEMWECLNVTAHGLPGQKRAAERLGPHVYLRYIRERAALFFGLADSTMSHDDAWRFLVLGRSSGARRHDRPAAAGPDVGARRPRLAGAAARLRRARVVHPDPRLGRRADPGGRVPAARPAVPAQRGASRWPPRRSAWRR